MKPSTDVAQSLKNQISFASSDPHNDIFIFRIFLAFCLAYFLTVFLAYVLAFYLVCFLALPSGISSAAQFLTVDCLSRRTGYHLLSSAPVTISHHHISSGISGGWGPTLPTLIWLCHWGPALPTAMKSWRREARDEERWALIKSNNPHLAGGEKMQKQKISNNKKQIMTHWIVSRFSFLKSETSVTYCYEILNIYCRLSWTSNRKHAHICPHQRHFKQYISLKISGSMSNFFEMDSWEILGESWANRKYCLWHTLLVIMMLFLNHRGLTSNDETNEKKHGCV